MSELRETKYNNIQIYIHIPFCVKKCNYCDFLSAPYNGEQQKAYMGALFSEIAGRAGEYADYAVSSIFIGGGTPSVLEGVEIAKLLAQIGLNFQVLQDAEITIEVNPGTVDGEKLKTYYQAGVNRLSIGLQSANDDELHRLGRIHTYEQFLDTYRWAREAGFNNINVDVMSALPGQNLDSYGDTLQKLLALKPVPEHISAYSLIVEEGTHFAQLEQEGKLDLPDEDCERYMYEETKRILGGSGFHRYEISNYAREGFECRHNCGYWKRREYVGFGIGAASLVNNTRFCNDGNFERYIENPLECRSEFQVLSVREQMEETMFLGLRMTEGVSTRDFKEIYGRTMEEVYGPVISRNVQDGLLEYAGKPHRSCTEDNCDMQENQEPEENQEMNAYLKLTEKGLDVSNYVMSQFLLDED